MNLKTSLDTNDVRFKAARRRAADELFRTFTTEELDARTQMVLARPLLASTPMLEPGSPMSSTHYRAWVQDSKYFVGSIVGQVDALDKEVQRFDQDIRSSVDSLYRSLEVLRGQAIEDESKIIDNFDITHYNSFVRIQDQGLGAENKEWLIDPKTGDPVVSSDVISTTDVFGITLPTDGVVVLPIVGVKVVEELSTAGDTDPVAYTEPLNVVLPGKAFRYLISLQAKSEGWTQELMDPQMVLQCDFPTFMAFNAFDIKPLASATLVLVAVEYLNTDLAWTTLSYDSFTVVDLVRALCTEVVAKAVRFTFSQSSPVTRTAYEISDKYLTEINQHLVGAGWSSQLDTTSSQVQGSIYDFSISDIAFSYRNYRGSGVWRSQPIKISRPIGISLTTTEDYTDVGAEKYLGMKLYGPKGFQYLDSLCPIPDAYPTQTEVLLLNSGVGSLKLYPDLFSHLRTVSVVSAVKTGSTWEIELAETLGLETGVEFTDQELRFLTRVGHELNNQVLTYEATNTTDLTLTLESDTGAATSIPSSAYPEAVALLLDEQPDPLEVLENNVWLEIGLDYELSLDAGKSWLSAFPVDQTLREKVRQPYAGDCLIRILDPKATAVYKIEYRVAPRQFLARNKLVKLQNGRVQFTTPAALTHGELWVVMYLRGASTVGADTPVVRNYLLKVKEYHGS